MRRILTICLGMALMLGAAFAVMAQGHFHHKPAGPAGVTKDASGDFLARALDLNDEQKAAVQKLHDELVTKSQSLVEQHHQQLDGLHTLLASPSPDPTEVGRQLIAAYATGQQLTALHEDFTNKVSALLNADQLEKFKNLHEMHREHRPFGLVPGPGF